MPVPIKTDKQIAALRRSGQILARIHEATRYAIRPGITTADLDRIAADILVEERARSAFLNYHPEGASIPFPASITVSINDELVHGVPGSRVIQSGDLVKVDCGVVVDSMITDAAYTYPCGDVSPEETALSEAVQAALHAGIAMARDGVYVREVSEAIYDVLDSAGFAGGILKEYAGHGVGASLWETPTIPNWWPRARQSHRFRNVQLRSGMVIALEPMVTLGEPRVEVLPDGWTVRTLDGARCAHHEHTILITDGTAEILTAPP